MDAQTTIAERFKQLGLERPLQDLARDLKEHRRVPIRSALLSEDIHARQGDGAGVIECIGSTDGVKRDGNRVRNDLGSWNFNEFVKNPVMTWCHDWSVPTIGHWMDQQIIAYRGGFALKLVGKFAIEDEFANRIYKLYLGKHMRAFSIEWTPDEYEELRDASGRMIGFDFIRNTLLGCAAVPMPADPDAITLAVRSGSLTADEAQGLQNMLKRGQGLVYTISHLDAPRESVVATKGRTDDPAPRGEYNRDGEMTRWVDEKGNHADPPTHVLPLDENVEHFELSLDLSVVRKIVKEDDGWHVYSQDGTKHLGGPYATKAEAVDRLKQIEGNKSAAAASWKCGAARGLPVDEGTWDGAAAAASVFSWAGWPDNPDSSKAAKAFLAYDSANSDLKGSYKLPFAKVSGGKLTAVRAGLNAAAARLNQTDIPDSVKSSAQSVIDSYKPADKKKAGMVRGITSDALDVAYARLKAAYGAMDGPIDALAILISMAYVEGRAAPDPMVDPGTGLSTDAVTGLVTGPQPSPDVIPSPPAMPSLPAPSTVVNDPLDELNQCARWVNILDALVTDCDNAIAEMKTALASAPTEVPGAPDDLDYLVTPMDDDDEGTATGMPMAPSMGGAPAAATRIGKKIAASRMEKLQACVACLDQAGAHVRDVIASATDGELDSTVAAGASLEDDPTIATLAAVSAQLRNPLEAKVAELIAVAADLPPEPEPPVDLLEAVLEQARRPAKRTEDGYVDHLLGTVAELCNIVR